MSKFNFVTLRLFALTIVLSGCNVQNTTTATYEGYDGYQYETLSNEEDFWYDTGEFLPIGVNYHETNFLVNLKPGDIIYEDNGGFGITGHIAIVENIFYSEQFSQYYVRLIEAINVGVARSILTPTRFEQKVDTAFRVTNTNEQTINSVINFVIDQLNKPYEIALWKNADASNPDWYCSELIWAAYYHQDIFLDIDDNNNHGSVVFPKEIIQSPLLTQVQI